LAQTGSVRGQALAEVLSAADALGVGEEVPESMVLKAAQPVKKILVSTDSDRNVVSERVSVFMVLLLIMKKRVSRNTPLACVRFHVAIETSRPITALTRFAKRSGTKSGAARGWAAILDRSPS